MAIQPNEFALGGLMSTVILPITTNILDNDAFPLRVRIPKGIAELIKDSEILIDQILAWDNELFCKEIGLLPEPLIAQVKLALNDFLDLLS